MIHQGEQFKVPFKIKADNSTVITPSNCADVRIQIGKILKEYSAGQITYDAQRTAWLYPLTEEDTAEMRNSVPFEVAVLFADQSIIKSTVDSIMVYDSIIKEGWID